MAFDLNDLFHPARDIQVGIQDNIWITINDKKKSSQTNPVRFHW